MNGTEAYVLSLQRAKKYTDEAVAFPAWERLRQEFIEKYGNITLLDSPMSDWEMWIEDQIAIIQEKGRKHLYGAYDANVMVEVWIDPNGTYPLLWQWANHWYGKNSDGISEIISVDDAIRRSQLSDAVLEVIDHGIVDGGEFDAE